MSFSELANAYIQTLVPYEIGKPVEDVAREFGLDPSRIAKLASNENPLGPSPRALEAARRSVEEMHFYPDGGSFYLRQAVAREHGVDPSLLTFGCGSNEIIQFVAQAFTAPGGGEIVASRYAFIVYKLIAHLLDVRFIETPDKDYGHDLEAMRKAITPGTRIVFIANPNNPTGNRLPNGELEAFIRSVPSHCLVCLDEAYYEFLDNPPPSIEWVKQGLPVIVLRTFSKIHGLAGLRIGYSVALPEITQMLERCRQPFNITSTAQAAALAALEDKEHVATTKRLNAENRALLASWLENKRIPFVPSEGNFIMAKTGQGRATFQALMRHGVIVRPLAPYGLPDWLRLSIGSTAQIGQLTRALEAVLGERAATEPAPA
jgi:histidinol-phosphate aminotransferase